MKRIFPILSLLSLLVWILLLAAWVRSLGGPDGIGLPMFGGLIDFSAEHKVIVTVIYDWPRKEDLGRMRGFSSFRDLKPFTWPNFQPVKHVVVPGLDASTFPQAQVIFVTRSTSYQTGILIMGNRFVFSNYRVITVIMSWSLLICIPAILPACWTGMTYRNHRRRAYRLQNHLCLACGYDLRASTDKCPECGTAIPFSPSPSARGSG